MRNFLLLFLLLMPVIGSCTDDYDDSAAWKDIDGIYKDLDQLKEKLNSLQLQADALSQIIKGGAITSVTEAANGGYVISYKGSDNIEHSFTIATTDQMISSPIIGIQEEAGIYYWTTTTKGQTTFLLDANKQKIPVSGSAPQIRVDENGYWVINGQHILDSNQKPIKAEGKTTSLITKVEINDNGTASITLGNGETLSVSTFTLFNVEFKNAGQSAVSPIIIEEGIKDLTLDYQIVGKKAAQALMLITRTDDGLEAKLNSNSKTLAITFSDEFEEGATMIMLYDTEDNILIKPVRFTLPVIENGGIATGADFKAFIDAVTSGSGLRKFKDAEGNVILLNDIDMKGITLTSGAGSEVTSNTTKANTKVVYTVGQHTFNGTFDGKGHSISNLTCTYDLEDGNIAHGLFNALGSSGMIRNLVISGNATITGAAPQGAAIGGLVGYCEGSILACTNQMNLSFEGTDGTNFGVRMGGLVGVLYGNNIGDATQANGCINEGTLTCGNIVNIGSGAYSAFNQGGIAGYVENDEAYIGYAINKGAVSAPTGRGGGIAGTLQEGTIENCVNEGLIQDDVNDVLSGTDKRYNVKRIGGLAGGINTDKYMKNCINNGNVYSQNGSRAGGFVGHNAGYIQECTNNGTILSDATADGSNKHGAGWACGYSGTKTGTDYITDCHIGGKVGDYSIYKNNPEDAPAATYSNAVRHGAFSKEANNFSNQDEAYYDWTIVEDRELASGIVYKHYSFSNFNQNIYAIEIDMNNPKVTFETAMADEICPNPNGNNNSNNGKILRETLSETCTRRRAEGRNIVVGINTGFFNSHDGFPRGIHIEEGEPVFINNPYVRATLTNHVWGFTYFEDRTVSFEKRDFTGKLKVGMQEYEYYSVNDTIVRLSGQPSYDANLYTHRFVKEPHPGISNPIGAQALFIVGRNDRALQVNSGDQDATITQIIDGRSTTVEAPYVTGKEEWVLQVTGDKANELAQSLKTGDKVKISAEIKIGSSTAPIKVHNSSMYRFLYNGVYAAPPKKEDAETINPTTNLGMTQDKSKMILFCVDGRTDNDRGLDFYEAYRVSKKLGLYDVIRFDGGGSTVMWTYENGIGKVINHVSDTKGERSCMNYLHVRVLE